VWCRVRCGRWIRPHCDDRGGSDPRFPRPTS
jgi:hypothetical protein